MTTRPVTLCALSLCALAPLAPAGVLFSGGEWDFEAGFYQQPNFDRVATVGNGWQWWSDLLEYQGVSYGFGSINENKNPANVSRGERSQEITMTCATGWAGLYRTITVPVNHRIRIEFDARTTPSEVDALIFLGVNLNGGTDHDYDAPATTWYDWGGTPGPWVRVSQTVVSTGSRLTLFVAERHEYPSCTGATFLFDNVEVFDDGPAGPVTDTPTPTLTPTYTPTSTPIPDADGDAVPDALEGNPPAPGQSNRYLPDSDGDGLADGEEDLNRNGQRDAGETDARDADSDGDGYEDGIERVVGGDPLDPGLPAAPLIDADGDRLPALIDLTDDDPDSDDDRFTDGYETATLSLNAAYSDIIVPGLGDATGDLAVSNVDALAIQALFLGMVAPETLMAAHADPNRDGFFSNVDALVVQAYFLQLLPRLPN